MRRATRRALVPSLTMLIGVLLAGCGQKGAERESAYTPRLVVYGPCGLQEPLEAVQQLFRARHPEVRVDLMLDSSNVQVRKVTDLGEHPDIFISPGELELKRLRDRSLIEESSVRDLGSLDMAIIAPSSRGDVRALADLTSPNVKIVSMGDPKSTSVGYYGAQVLRKLKLWESL